MPLFILHLCYSFPGAINGTRSLQSHWEALACWTLSSWPGRSCCPTTWVWQKCSTVTHVRVCSCWQDKLSWGGHGDVCPACTLQMSQCVMSAGTGLSHWPQVGICPGVWTANTLGPMCCTDMEIWVQNLTLKHNLIQHNWVILSANLVTVSREKLCHSLGCPAVSPAPLECKAHNAWRKMPLNFLFIHSVLTSVTWENKCGFICLVSSTI